MANKTSMGVNRTGAATSPKHTKQLHEASARVKKPSMDGRAIVEVRRSYVNGGTIGSVPHPVTARGVGKAIMEMLRGARAPALTDRISERLCSERSAIRLYEALIAKEEATGSWPGGPTRKDLEMLREEEIQNYRHLYQQARSLGLDPTALSPSANLAGVALSGVFDVLADPRTDFRQCMEAMLIAEHADNAYWESLFNLAQQMGHEEMAAGFYSALAIEARHTSLIRSWVLLGHSTAAKIRITGEKAWGLSKGNGRRKPRTAGARTTKRRPRAQR